MQKFVLNLARQPLVHFIVLGTMLGVGLQWSTGDPDREDATTIRISATDVARMDAAWRSRWNRPPTAEELDGLVKAQIREIALYREAITMGLDQNEPVIRRVLVQKLERMANDLIELSLAPTEQDLAQYHAQHAERYRPSSLITFTHVFIDPDSRGDTAIEDAEAVVAELQALGAGTELAERYGDPFMLQRYYPEKELQRIASLFGRGFAEPLFELSIGEWHGPVLSGYGLHAVYVHARVDSPVPPLDEVRERVTEDWVDDQRREITDRYFAELLARYEVVIEGQPDDAPIELEAAAGS